MNFKAIGLNFKAIGHPGFQSVYSMYPVSFSVGTCRYLVSVMPLSGKAVEGQCECVKWCELPCS